MVNFSGVYGGRAAGRSSNSSSERDMLLLAQLLLNNFHHFCFRSLEAKRLVKVLPASQAAGSMTQSPVTISRCLTLKPAVPSYVAEMNSRLKTIVTCLYCAPVFFSENDIVVAVS
jgi:hypothetical protein